MAHISQKITNCLWFDNQAEEAAIFYTSIFQNSSIKTITRFTKEGFEFHHQPEGSVMTVAFLLDGVEFLALNSNPQFKFNESISFIVNCDAQEEIDYYWNKLSEGGEESSCGWLNDKFGVSWQVVPVSLEKFIGSSNIEANQSAIKAMLQMKKIDIEVIEKAYKSCC